MYLVKKHLLPSGFEIFNASAGSGKTYQLTKSYLKLVLTNITAQRFRQILALTFTNKAVAEMKGRILDSLYDFGNPKTDKTNNSLFGELAVELGFSAKELERKSSLALRLLLHNYNFFEVSTIDKFTYSVIKTFAKDLKISQNFEVELDGEILLVEAIGQLLQKLDEDEHLKKVLIDFSLEKVEADKSWNVINDLINIGKLLFNENHYAHLQALQDKETKDFDELKEFFRSRITSSSNNISEYAGRALNLIKDNGLDFSDFKGKYFPKFLLTLQSGIYNVNFEASWKQHFDKLPLYNKVCPENTKVVLDGLHAQFSGLFNKIKSNIHSLSFFKNAYSNVLPLTVLNEISKEVSKIQKEKESLHISEFNKLVSKEIGNQPAPYIYERLGERYRYYFIDEFQDTSKMQWHNLVPLIGNALETEDLNGEKGSLLLVGDAKQSIYRWRGGDPHQFLDVNNGALQTFAVHPKISSLQTNWRSFDTIINFNNDFFTHAAHYLKEPAYQNLFLEQCQQQTNHRKGGYVEIVFAPEHVEDIALFYCEKVLDSIHYILDKGFSLKDVCILVRKNKEGVLLANYLAEHSISVVSSEALLLSNNLEVQFLVSLLRFLDSPSENIFQFDVLEYLFKEQNNKHDLIAQHLGNLTRFLLLEYDYDSNKEVTLSLLDILERAIFTFDLGDKCGGHVLHFLDVAQERYEKSGVGIYEFLSYWDVKKDALAVAAPLNQDAAQLMTIHKSKGLEFPFVIFPFADGALKSRMRGKKLWVPLSEELEPGFSRVLVNASKELNLYSSASKEIYTRETHLSELDDINVLYVAMTRAIQGLFIVTNESQGETYGWLFKNYLLEKGLWATNTSCFTFGSFLENIGKKSEDNPVQTIPYIYTPSTNTVKLALMAHSFWEKESQKSMEWGKALHELLSRMNSREDIETALHHAAYQGDISMEAVETVRNIVLSIINHPELSMFYSEDGIVKNEVEIISSTGNLFRPDRLVFHDHNVTIIDYKTGDKRPEHAQQLKTYTSLLEELGFVVTHQILVYIGDEIEPVFI